MSGGELRRIPGLADPSLSADLATMRDLLERRGLAWVTRWAQILRGPDQAPADHRPATPRPRAAAPLSLPPAGPIDPRD